MANQFLVALVGELRRAERNYPPLHSEHEAYAVIAEELDEFWDEVRKQPGDRDYGNIRKELIQIAAMAWRAAKDLGVEEASK